MLHCTEMAQKRAFITADFKLEYLKMSLRKFSQQGLNFKTKFKVLLETTFWERSLKD